MRNTKFFPIVPDGGSESDVPTALQAWSNGHRFTSGNERIRRLIFNEPCSADSAGSANAGVGPGDAICRSGSHHERLAAELLSTPGASTFIEALKADMTTRLGMLRPSSAGEIVHRFSESQAAEVQKQFFCVRAALKAVPAAEGDGVARRQAEEAAAALYCLAACRLVEQSAPPTGSTPALGSSYLLHVPTSERVICAVIATALFGGKLRFTSSEQVDLPMPEYVFEVRP